MRGKKRCLCSLSPVRPAPEKAPISISRLSPVPKENRRGRFFILVPDQFTMQTQKDLVSLHDRKGIMNIDV